MRRYILTECDIDWPTLLAVFYYQRHLTGQQPVLHITAQPGVNISGNEIRSKSVCDCLSYPLLFTRMGFMGRSSAQNYYSAEDRVKHNSGGVCPSVDLFANFPIVPFEYDFGTRM